MNFETLIALIKKTRLVVQEFIPLVLDIGTLIAVIRMIQHNIH